MSFSHSRSPRNAPGTIAVIVLLVMGLGGCSEPADTSPIRLGILHSLTGPQGFNERRLVDAELLAIEEINAAGGLLGRKVEAVTADGQSNADTFAEGTERLIADDRVSAIIGGGTSSDRKTVLPVIEWYESLLLYPLAYEGLEQSSNVIYTGSTPNQQTLPAVRWFLENRGTRFFLVGSDDIRARSQNAIIKDTLDDLGGTVVGEEYLAPHQQDTSAIAERIADAKPQVIVNALNHGLVGFFRSLSSAGIDPHDTPIFSLAVGEDTVRTLRTDEIVGSYAVWPYFQSLGTEANQEFTTRFKDRNGNHRRTDDQINNAYVAVRLWAQAVTDAGTDNPAVVAEAARRQTLAAPEGRIWVDEVNGHVWRSPRIGKVQADGQFDIVWTSETTVRPEPYPATRTKSEWEEFQQDLYRQWERNWFLPPS